MKVVVLDTNALMAVGQFKVDVFSEVDRVMEGKVVVKVLDGTVRELEKIKREQKGKFKDRARLALAIVKRKRIRKIQSGQVKVDDFLVALSKKGFLVLTQDLGLKRRLTKPYLTIRQKKRVVLV